MNTAQPASNAGAVHGMRETAMMVSAIAASDGWLVAHRSCGGSR
ncbi:hypothetical protein [Tessaracoccus coleopterorum]|nr:hypothetical protein [Tessaracoccus coleopterorum]